MRLSKKITGCLLFLFLLFNQSLLAQNTDGFEGLWSAENMEDSQIELYQDADNLWYAQIKAAKEDSQKGKILFKDGVLDAAKNELKGTLIKPDGNMEIDATITVENDQQLKIVGRKFFMKKTFFWTRL